MKEDIFYHYTSIESLNSIIRSGTIWASDCRYLNDRQELVRATELFLGMFNGLEREALSWALNWHNTSRAHCIFSLSRSSRVLSQWRAYADDGRGAAIGFSSKFLIGSNNTPTRLIDCIYENHENFLEHICTRHQQEIKELVEIYRETRAINAFWELIDKKPQSLENLYGELLKIKNPAFLEEQEVRLVFNVPIKQTQTRVSGGLIIPYIEHAFIGKNDQYSIWCVAPEIWLGPKCDERNMTSLMAFQQFGWTPGSGLYKFDCGYM